jgi:hypothetical protein
MQIGAGNLDGTSANSARSASMPPAEAPITTICLGLLMSAVRAGSA